MSEPSTDTKFEAFISYRHGGQDERWARWLHSALETYRVPKHLITRGLPRRRIGRCFLDVQELSASANLSQEIEAALRQSRYLIVICSPRTPESRWVDREVQLFRQWGRHDRILALLVEGEPDQSFPKSLQEAPANAPVDSSAGNATIEPLAADARHIRHGSLRTIRKLALLRLAAVLLGVSFDELRQREQQRQARRLMLTISVLLAISITFAFLGILATVEKLEADRQRSIAATESQRAEEQLTRLTIKNGTEQIDRGDLMNALPWYHYALKRDRDKPQRLGVHRLRTQLVLQKCPLLLHIFDMAIQVRFPDQGDLLAVVKSDGIDLVDQNTGKITCTIESANFYDCCFTKDCQRLIAFGKGLQVFDCDSGKPVSEKLWARDQLTDVALSASGGAATVVDSAKTIKWLDTRTGRSFDHIPKLARDETRALRHVDCTGDWLLTGHEYFSSETRWIFQVWDLRSKKPVCTFADSPNDNQYEGATLASDATTAALRYRGDSGAVVQFRDARTGQQSAPDLNLAMQLRWFKLSPDGQHLLVLTDREIGWGSYRTLSPEARVYEVASGRMMGVPCQHEDELNWVEFSPTGEFFLTASERYVRVWETWTTNPVTPPIRHRYLPSYTSFDSTGRRLAVSGQGIARVWDLAFGGEDKTLLDGKGRRIKGEVGMLAFANSGEFVCGLQWQQTHIWNWKTDAYMSIEEEGHSVDSIACASKKPWVAMAGVSGRPSQIYAQVWDLRENKPVGPKIYHPPSLSNESRLDPLICFDPSEQRVLVTGRDGSAQVWQIADGQPVSAPLVDNPEEVTAGSIQGNWIKDCAFNNDGTLVVLGTDRGLVKVWNVQQGQLLRPAWQAPAEIVKTQFGEHFFLAAASSRFDSEGRVHIWMTRESQDPEVTLELKSGITTFALSPDGLSFAIAATDGEVRVWKLEPNGTATGPPRPTLSPISAPMLHPGRVNAVVFNGQGSQLLTAGGDPPPAWTQGFHRLWDALSGDAISPWNTHQLAARSAAFHPQGDGWVVGEETLTAHREHGPTPAVDELALLSELVTDAIIDQAGGLKPLTDNDRKICLASISDWREKVAWGQAHQRERLWHEQRASRAESANLWRIADVHLDHLAAIGQPTDGVYLRRAAARLHQQKFDLAIQDCNRILEKEPMAEAFQIRGEAYIGREDWEKAANDLEQALTNMMISDGDEKILLNTAPAELVFDIALAQAQMGQRQKAVQTLNRLWLVQQTHFVETHIAQWQESGYLQAAVAGLDMLLNEFGASNDWFRRRGVLLRQLGRTQEALKDFDSVLQTDEKLESDWRHRGEVYADLANWAAASRDFEQALEAGSNQLSAYMGWLLTALAQDNLELYNQRAMHIRDLSLEAENRIRTLLVVGLLVNRDVTKDFLQPLRDELQKTQEPADPDAQLIASAVALRMCEPTDEAALRQVVNQLASVQQSARAPVLRDLAQAFSSIAQANLNKLSKSSSPTPKQPAARPPRYEWWIEWMLERLQTEARSL